MLDLIQRIFNRQTFAERVLLLSLAGGIIGDGFLNHAFQPLGTEGIIRCVIVVLALTLFGISFHPRITRKGLQLLAFGGFSLLMGFSFWLNYTLSFEPNNAITLFGIIVVCSLYFRTLRGLLIYLGLSLLMTCIVIAAVKEPHIDTNIFLIRMVLGDLLVIGLSHTTRIYFSQLQKRNQFITEQNKTLLDQQNALAKRLTQEQLLALVANKANAAVIITSSDDKIEWVNAIFSTITGYSQEELLGRDPSFLRGEGTDPSTIRRIQQYKLNPRPFVEEILNYRKDGVPIWLELNVSPLLNEQGGVVRWIAIQEDITERKKMMLALESNREQLNIAQQQAKIGSWVWATEEDRIQCSDELCRLLGIHGTTSITSTRFFEAIHPSDRDVVRKAIESGQRRQSAFEIDHRLLIDRQVINVYTTGQADTEKRCFFGTMQNISERKRLEEEMRQAEIQYRRLFENSQHMICIHDMDGTIMSINPAGAHALGYETEELIGRRIPDFIAQDVRNQYEDYIRVLQQSGANQGLLKLNNRNGEPGIWLFNNIRLLDVNGNPFALCSNVNITERYHMEIELRQAKKTAEEALKIKDRFVANISHEMRTPMNSIIGFTDVLLKTSLNTEQKEYISAVKIASETLTAVINDILDLAKIEAGKIEFNEAPYNIRQQINDVHRLLAQRAEESGLTFTWSCAENVPDYILGDELRLRQILLNLAGNAVKFTTHGFVEMKCQIEEETENGLLLRFTISDTGVGIPQNQLNLIFDPFIQTGTDIHKKYAGTGLGLTIVKDLVELQGGDIQVKSTVGKGSVFTVLLPVRQVGTASLQQVEEALVSIDDPHKITILLVEDHPLNQQLARKLIGDFGFQIVVASNGDEALQVLRTKSIQLILMDLNMPVMDGYEATQLIRQQFDVTIPIIALTAHSSFGERERCLAIGMNDYLSKPFRAQDLYFKIGRFVGQRREEKIEFSTTENNNPLQSLAAGNITFEKEMLLLMKKSIPTDLELLETALHKHDITIARSTAHRLKSTVALAGAHTFAQHLQELETLLEKSDIPSDSQSNFSLLKKEKEELLVQIQLRLDEIG